MAVTVRQKSEKIETITGNTTVTEPAGASSGDVLFALALADSGTTLTRPASWTQLYSGTQGTFMFDVSYIQRGGSAPSLTWAVTGTLKYREVYVVCLQAGAAISLDSQSASGGTGNSQHNPDPPSTTAVATTSLALSGGVNYGGSQTGGWTVSAGYTAQTLNANGDDGFMQSKSLSAAGAENPAALGNGALGAQDWWDGFTVTFTDVASGVTAAQEAGIFDQQRGGNFVGLMWR